MNNNVYCQKRALDGYPGQNCKTVVMLVQRGSGRMIVWLVGLILVLLSNHGMAQCPVEAPTAIVRASTDCINPNGTITFSGPNPATHIFSIDGGATFGTLGQTVFSSLPPGSYQTVAQPVSETCVSDPVEQTVEDACVLDCDLVTNLTTTPSANCITPNASFTITYSGAGSYQYNLNGGANTPMTASPLVVGNLAPGSYTLVVSEVSSVSCLVNHEFVIEGPELIASVYSNAPACTGSTLQFGANAGGGTQPYSYAWSGPNGFNASTANPTIPTATTAHNGTYTLTITDAGGCSTTASTEVEVINAPSLAITGGNSQTLCSGLSTTLAVGGSNGSTVIWSSNFGHTGTGTSIPVQYTNAGTEPTILIYELSAEAGDCSDTESLTVVVNPEPRIQVMPSAAVYCDIEQVMLTANAFPATATINWTRTPNTPTPPADSGSGTGTITINQTLPAAGYTFGFTATNPVTGCSSQLLSVPVTVQQ